MITRLYGMLVAALRLCCMRAVPCANALCMQIGPVAWLFRWYAKRNTQFAEGGPTPEDLVDAPPLPPPDPVGPGERGCLPHAIHTNRLQLSPHRS